MITRAMISFDIQKEDRWYHFLIPNGAPYAEAQEALAQAIAFIEQEQKAALLLQEGSEGHASQAAEKKEEAA